MILLAREIIVIIYCAFENRASQKAHSISRILTAYGKRVNFLPLNNMRAPKKAKKREKTPQKTRKRLMGGVALSSDEIILSAQKDFAESQ